MNDFEACLKQSHAAEDWPVWGQVYTQAFPQMLEMISHREDGPHQRAGIDRSVIMANSKQILIDEKARGRNKITGKVYDDIALEYMSDAERSMQGWVCKPLLADYIAYAILPLGKCYLLPVIQLQAAWEANKGRWLKQYGTIKAKNPTWTTLSCCVSPDELFSRIGACLRLTFDAIDHTEGD